MTYFLGILIEGFLTLWIVIGCLFATGVWFERAIRRWSDFPNFVRYVSLRAAERERIRGERYMTERHRER